MIKSKNSNNEDCQLIKLIKKHNCNDSFKRLQDKHSKLFYSICNKFSKDLSLDEVYKDKDFVMWKAVMSYKDTKGAKFSTWFGNYARYHCLNYIKSNHKYVITDDDKMSHFFNTKSLDEFNNSKNHADDLDFAMSILKKLSDKRIFKIFKLRYMHDGPKLTWKQIAQKFDLTPQTIINLHSKGRRILVKKMKNKS